jgi:hypothetical protein
LNFMLFFMFNVIFLCVSLCGAARKDIHIHFFGYVGTYRGFLQSIACTVRFITVKECLVASRINSAAHERSCENHWHSFLLEC